jgi:hypothetical protein
LDLSVDSEKNSISQLINDSLNEINVIISNEKKKMEKFEYSENMNYNKMKPIELNKENLKNVESIDIDIRQFLENRNESINGNIKRDNEERDEEIKLNVSHNRGTIVNNKTTVNNPTVSQNILSNEEIRKFVYDFTKENLTSSSFKFAFRNFEDDLKEKEEFLLKINPSYIPIIFVNDMDKNILIEILNCLKSILNRKNEA